MAVPKCTKCGFEMVKDEDLGNGYAVYACMYCDMPQQPGSPYENHCWNCGDAISSETCKASSIPGMGYCCNTCGKDLVDWHLMKGNITSYNLSKILQKNQWRMHAVL